MVGLCLFLGNIKEDINEKNAKTNATEKWTPKNQDAKKKCKNNAKKMQIHFIAKIATFSQRKNSDLESIFSAFYTMKRRNNGFWQTVATQYPSGGQVPLFLRFIV